MVKRMPANRHPLPSGMSRITRVYQDERPATSGTCGLFVSHEWRPTEASTPLRRDMAEAPGSLHISSVAEFAHNLPPKQHPCHGGWPDGMMTRRQPLPLELANRSFRVADALAAGVTPSRLRALDLVSPGQGRPRSGPGFATAHGHGSRRPAGVRRSDRSESAARVHRLRARVRTRARARPIHQPREALALIGCPLPRVSLPAFAARLSAPPRRECLAARRSCGTGCARGRRPPDDHEACRRAPGASVAPDGDAVATRRSRGRR